MNDLREQNENKSLVPANEKWIVLILSIGSNFVNHLRRWMTWFHFGTKLNWNVFRPHKNFKLQRFFTLWKQLQWLQVVVCSDLNLYFKKKVTEEFLLVIKRGIELPTKLRLSNHNKTTSYCVIQFSVQSQKSLKDIAENKDIYKFANLTNRKFHQKNYDIEANKLKQC